MKNLRISKKVILCVIITIMCMLSGCSYNTDVKCDTTGKGVVTYRIAIDKNSVEETEYTNFNTLEEFAECLASKIDPETGLEVTTDRTSSDKEDYICVSFKYNTIDEYEENIDKVLSKYNLMVVENDFNSMIGYHAEKENYVYELQGLEEYLKENGIDIDIKNRNIRKFIKIVGNYINRYGEFYDHEFRNKDDDFYDVRIVEQDGSKVLRVNSIAMSYIGMYIRRVAEKYNTEFFNNSYIKTNAFAQNGLSAKEVFKMTLSNIDFATDIKKILDEEGSVNGYSMNEFTPLMTVKLFTQEYARRFNEEYTMAYMQYEENNVQEEKLELSIGEELYKDRDTFYNISFGDNEVVMTKDEFFDKIDSEGHVAIPEKSELDSDLKEHNETLQEGLDEVPFSGDNMRMMTFMMLAGMAMIVMVAVVFLRIKR